MKNVKLGSKGKQLTKVFTEHFYNENFNPPFKKNEKKEKCYTPTQNTRLDFKTKTKIFVSNRLPLLVEYEKLIVRVVERNMLHLTFFTIFYIKRKNWYWSVR